MAIVSHDLKNPLSVIQMNLRILKGKLAENSSLIRIQNSTTRMTSLIQDILDFSKLRAGPISFDKKPCSLADILKDFNETWNPLVAAKKLKLSTNFPKEMPTIYCNPERVFRVFSNLIGNAIKFTPENGAIQVSAEKKGQEVIFSIRDTGPGISEQELPHLFEPYWQVKKSSSVGGVGLGLSIAKGIVEGHGGKIWVASQVGVGSTFYFSLPLAKEDQKAA